MVIAKLDITMDDILAICLVVFSASCLCGFVSIPVVQRFCRRRGLYDAINERKLHTTQVPRLGGVVFIPSMLAAVSLTLPVFGMLSGRHGISVSLWTGMFLVSIAVVYIVGIVDDIAGLSARVKLLAQVCAAALMPASGLYINNLYGLFGVGAVPFAVGAPLTVFAIVFVVNAVNLIDGIDGLAGSLAVLALAGFFKLFWDDGVFVYCALIAGLLGVLSPYLYYNMSAGKYKIFMGDSGSLSLGFILGFLSVKYSMYNPGVMPYHGHGLIAPFSLLAVPVMDVVRVSLWRLSHGRPVFGADKNHIHHRLMAAGLTQHGALAAILSLAVALAVVNTVAYGAMGAGWTAALDIAVYTLFHIVVSAAPSKAKEGGK